MKILNRSAIAAATFGAVLALAGSYSFAQGSLLRNDLPDSYVVQDTDTLWNIASQFLQDPERWPDVWRPDPYLDNSDFIYPGDILRIGYVDGAPRVLVQRGDRTETRLGPVMREQNLASTIPAIPLESIENSFTRNRIVSQEMLDAAPYIVQNLGDNLAIATGDEIYARGTWPVGTTSFEVYRPFREHIDPDDDDISLGTELEYLGFVSITNVESEDIRRLLVNNSSKEIRVSDRLLVREVSEIGATIFPTEPQLGMEGRIVAFLGNETMASQLDTIVLDIGTFDNLAVGDVLAVVKEDYELVDGIERERMSFRERMASIFNRQQLELPGDEIGTILVYRTFERMSYGVILTSVEPIELNSRLITP